MRGVINLPSVAKGRCSLIKSVTIETSLRTGEGAKVGKVHCGLVDSNLLFVLEVGVPPGTS